MWFNEIGNQLADTNLGIVCLTKENRNKPWILFETGALTKGLSTSRVCPFLIDLTPQDVVPPLSQLNLTIADKDGLYTLVRTINSSTKDGQLPIEILQTVFETYWSQFEGSFKKILSSTNDAPQVESRDEKDILSELLSTVRALDNRIRRVEIEKIREIDRFNPSNQNVESNNFYDYHINYFYNSGVSP